MGTEIVAITIANLYVFTCVAIIRMLRMILGKCGKITSDYGELYKSYAICVALLAFSPSIALVLIISANYDFAVQYIAIIHVPIVLLTLWILMPLSEWKEMVLKR